MKAKREKYEIIFYFCFRNKEAFKKKKKNQMKKFLIDFKRRKFYSIKNKRPSDFYFSFFFLDFIFIEISHKLI